MLTARVRMARLDLASPSSAGYLRSSRRPRQLGPGSGDDPQASVTWHYQVVLNGLAVSLPALTWQSWPRRPASRRSAERAYRPLLDQARS